MQAKVGVRFDYPWRVLVSAREAALAMCTSQGYTATQVDSVDGMEVEESMLNDDGFIVGYGLSSAR